MKESGYSAAFSCEVIYAGVTTYKQQLKRDLYVTCPLYRPKCYLTEEKSRKREVSKMGWNPPYNTVLCFPPTPARALAKSLGRVLETEAKSTGLIVKVVERAGKKLCH